MNKYIKILPVILFLCGAGFITLADRGNFGKKSTVALNIDINPAGSLKNSIKFNLKSGLQYKGSVLLNQQHVGSAIVSDAYVSYKKGNTVYIIPYKQKVLVPKSYTSPGAGFTISLGK